MFKLLNKLKGIFMSDENNQEVPAPAEGAVGQEQQASAPEANVEAKAEERAPEADAPVDGGPAVVASAENLDEALAAAPVEVFYHGNQVVERLETVNEEGRECRMSDGSTMFVPLSVLGE